MYISGKLVIQEPALLDSTHPDASRSDATFLHDSKWEHNSQLPSNSE